MTVVGMHGRIGAGKNETARLIAELADVPVRELSLAAPLKLSAAAALGVHASVLETWKRDPDVLVTISRREWGRTRVLHSQTVREYLQRYGTEAHRDVFGESFWVDAVLPASLDHSDRLVVVTDVRFPNEAARVRELGGHVVGIRGPDDEAGEHRSEHPLECDLWIDNTVRDDDHRSLRTQVSRLLAILNVPLKSGL